MSYLGREWGKTKGKGVFNLRTGEWLEEEEMWLPEKDLMYPGEKEDGKDRIRLYISC